MPRPRRKVKHEGGRFLVEDKSSSSLNAATAYAAALSMRERRDVYVRELGQEGWLVRCRYDQADRSTVITPAPTAGTSGRKRGSRV